jgi:hypothetical protein
VATTRVKPATRKEDERLREALKTADMEKFKQAVKAALRPAKKKSPSK